MGWVYTIVWVGMGGDGSIPDSGQGGEGMGLYQRVWVGRGGDSSDSVYSVGSIGCRWEGMGGGTQGTLIACKPAPVHATQGGNSAAAPTAGSSETGPALK